MLKGLAPIPRIIKTFFLKKKEEEEKERKKKLSAKNSNKPSPCLLQVCSARRGGRDGCLAPAKEGQRAHG